MPNRLMRWFDHQHLPLHLQPVSRHCANLAQYIDESIPDGDQKDKGLQKLIEAKDCFVRAKLEGEG